MIKAASQKEMMLREGRSEDQRIAPCLCGKSLFKVPGVCSVQLGPPPGNQLVDCYTSHTSILGIITASRPPGGVVLRAPGLLSFFLSSEVLPAIKSF